VFFGSEPLDTTADVVLTAPASRTAVAIAGDLNDDGYADVLAGAPGSSVAYVYYGGPGATMDGLADVTITSSFGFGNSVSGAGDVNGDGVDDAMVLRGGFGGSSWVLFGARGGTDATADLMLATGTTLYAVSSAGDVDGDGEQDAMVGVAGETRVFVGGPAVDATPDWLPGRDSSTPGIAVSGMGDCDDDGYGDVLTADSNTAYVYLGARLPLLDTSADWTFGTSTREPTGLGDVNGDGRADWAYVYSGQTAVRLGRAAPIGGGSAVLASSTLPSGVGDMNGDGYADVAARNASLDQVRVFLGGSGTSFDASPDATFRGAGGSGFGDAIARAGGLW
jgi:hypothetical protein